MSVELKDKFTLKRWRDALIFAGGTLFSRVLGLVRDILIGWYVPTFARDTFFFAFRLPNTFRDLLGEGAVNASFVPVLAEYDEREGRESMQRVTSAIFTAMFFILLTVTIVGVLLMPFVPDLLEFFHIFTREHPKSPEQMLFMVRVLQWSFPYLFWIGIAVFMMAPLFVLGDYSTPGFTPALLNVSLIFCVFLPSFFNINHVWALVFGLWLGGLLQASVLFFVAKRRLGGLGMCFFWRHPGVKKALVLLFPVIFGQAAGEVNKLVDSFFSYSLAEGTVSALFYANRMIQLPMAIFGTAISVSILPELTRYFANNELDKIRHSLREGIFQTLYMILPAMIMLSLLSEPIVRVLFEHGHFTAELTTKTANAIIVYSVGVIGFSAVKVLVQGFYSMHNTIVPVTTSAISMILNMALNFLLVGWLGYIGLTVSTSISFWFNCISLLFLLGIRIGNIMDFEFLVNIMKYITSIVIMFAVYFLLRWFFLSFMPVNRITEVGFILVTGITCSVVYFCVTWLVGIRESKQLLRVFQRKRV